LNHYAQLVEASVNRRRGSQYIRDMGSYWYTYYLAPSLNRSNHDWSDKWYDKRVNGHGHSLEKFIFPLNVAGNHWALAILHVGLRQVRVYDTMPADKRALEMVNPCLYEVDLCLI
jgi:Ulp1 family protease